MITNIKNHLKRDKQIIYESFVEGFCLMFSVFMIYAILISILILFIKKDNRIKEIKSVFYIFFIIGFILGIIVFINAYDYKRKIRIIT